MDFSDETVEDACRIAMDLVGDHCERGSRPAMEYAFFIGDGDPESFDIDVAGCRGHFEGWLWERLEHEVLEKAFQIGEALETDEDGRVVLWRAIHVASDWLETEIHERPIGVCWAWDPAFAIAHNAEGRGYGETMDIRVKCAVQAASVDWPMTLALNAADDFTVGEEREVRLRNDAVVELLEAAAGPDARSRRAIEAFRAGMRVRAGAGYEEPPMSLTA